MSGAQEAELAGAGWVRKFAAEPKKAREYAQIYEELGFEVRLEPEEASSSSEGECRVCLKQDGGSYLVIYARRK